MKENKNKNTDLKRGMQGHAGSAQGLAAPQECCWQAWELWLNSEIHQGECRNNTWSDSKLVLLTALFIPKVLTSQAFRLLYSFLVELKISDFKHT